MQEGALAKLFKDIQLHLKEAYRQSTSLLGSSSSRESLSTTLTLSLKVTNREAKVRQQEVAVPLRNSKAEY